MTAVNFTEIILIILVLFADRTESSTKFKSSSDLYKKLGDAIQSKDAGKSLALLDEHYFTRKRGIFSFKKNAYKNFIYNNEL